MPYGQHVLVDLFTPDTISATFVSKYCR